MKKKIPELDIQNIKKDELNLLIEKILKEKDYFKEHDINSLSNKKSNLLHLALNYKRPEIINLLLEEEIDLFQKNKLGMYPVFYTHSISDFNLLIEHPKVKSNPQSVNKLKELLFNDMVSPVYYWKSKDFKDFLNANKEMLSSLNDHSITFLLNLNQLLSIQLHSVWDKFKEDNGIEFSSKDIYLYIISKVKDNVSNNYRTYAFSEKESQRLTVFNEYKNELISLLHEGLNNKEKLKKIPKLKMKHYNDFYLLQTPEYEQCDFIYKELKLMKGSIKKEEITYIEHDLFLDTLLFQWKDYITKDKIEQNELKELCEENGLVGINISPVFSLSFIKKILNDLKKEAFKVFPVEDNKLFAENAYLKISNMFGKNSGYLQYANDRNILNINISDYSHGRENIFADELKDLKTCFVHEYTHFLQVVSEYHYKLDFENNEQWLKIENNILKTNDNLDNLTEKLKLVIVEEFERNNFDFKDYDKFEEYLNKAMSMTDIKEAKNIAQKIILLCPITQRSIDHKKYMTNNMEFIYNCINDKESNLQQLYLEKLNKDEYLENYYNDPVELHARLNEHLIKIKGKDLIRDFNFLSEEDNQMKKKVVLKDLKKFNQLILNHFEHLKKKTKKSKNLSNC